MIILLIFNSTLFRIFDLVKVLHWCNELEIPEVTVYAFSIENFKRSKGEVDALLSIFKEKIGKLLEERYQFGLL